jgi:hypothetical protein
LRYARKSCFNPDYDNGAIFRSPGTVFSSYFSATLAGAAS